MESKSQANFPLAFGFSCARFVLLAPDASARCVRVLLARVTAAFRQRGIVSDWRIVGKRKVCEGRSGLAHRVHSFSTSAKTVQFAGPSRARRSVFAAKREPRKIFLSAKFFRWADTKDFTCGKEFMQSAADFFQRLSGRSNS